MAQRSGGQAPVVTPVKPSEFSFKLNKPLETATNRDEGEISDDEEGSFNLGACLETAEQREYHEPPEYLRRVRRSLLKRPDSPVRGRRAHRGRRIRQSDSPSSSSSPSTSPETRHARRTHSTFGRYNVPETTNNSLPLDRRPDSDRFIGESWRPEVRNYDPEPRNLDVSGGAASTSSGSSNCSMLEVRNYDHFTPFFTNRFVFSNHYPAEFEIDDHHFSCTEQYYMWVKAMTFQDREAAEQILQTKDPKEMKRIGSKIEDFDEDVWSMPGRCAMMNANYAKYQQNRDLRLKLFRTAGTTLVECNPSDQRWGIGLGLNDDRVHDRSQWRGNNWLGEILTRIRDAMMQCDLYADDVRYVTREGRRRTL